MLDVTSPRGSFHIADGGGASGGACLRVNRAPSVASATTEFSSRCCLLLRASYRHLVSWSRWIRCHVGNLRKCNRQIRKATESFYRFVGSLTRSFARRRRRITCCDACVQFPRSSSLLSVVVSWYTALWSVACEQYRVRSCLVGLWFEKKTSFETEGAVRAIAELLRKTTCQNPRTSVPSR